jgi:hypothetical protein
MDYELHKLKAQVAVLKDVEQVYPTATISNAISQMQSRIKEIESRTKE